MTSKVQKTVLPNGLRIVTETLPYLYSVSVGIWVDNGSRDENPDENGIYQHCLSSIALSSFQFKMGN